MTYFLREGIRVQHTSKIDLGGLSGKNKGKDWSGMGSGMGDSRSGILMGGDSINFGVGIFVDF